MGTLTLQAVKNCWIRWRYPTTNYSSGNFATFDDLTVERFFLAFDAYPANIGFKPITLMMLHQYAVLPTDYSSSICPCRIRYGALSEDWDETEVTYQIHPSVTLTEYSAYHSDSQNYWFEFGLQGTFISTIRGILTYGVGFGPQSLDDRYERNIQLATRFHSTASLRPYVVITYDDANAYLTPTLRDYTRYYNPDLQRNLSYSTTASSLNTLETLSVESWRIMWKRPADSAWNTAAVSADFADVTIPADTFPHGVEDLQVKLSITDNGGTTTESNVITINTKDELITATPSSPVGGYRINETLSALFRWYNTSPNSTSQTGADLEWSVDGSTWSSLASVSGPYTNYIVPANTFPVADLYWRVRAYNADGDPGPWSDAATFTTIDTTSTATPSSPVNTVKDNGDDILFYWSVTNPSGSLPSGADLQYRTTGTEWIDLATVTGTSTHQYIQGGTFAAGPVSWRVRAYNRQGVAGPWSSPVSFVAVGAPPAPIVACDGKPFAKIEWQAEEQQAYMVMVDGETFGPYFGEGQTFVVQDPLEDGDHVVGVAVQNSFSLWSGVTEYVFTVTNEPGAAVDLSAVFNVDAVLSWSTESAAPQFLIYRDGKKIGASNQQTFTDRRVLGEHSYYVLNVLPDGYYTKSSEVTGTMKTCTTVIDTVQDPAGWMELRLTDRDPDEQTFSWQRTASLRHFTGSAYPVLEFSKYEDGSGTYNVAFKDPAAARAFETLKGKVVIIKSRGGNVMIGALLQLQKRVGHFYASYDFTVQRIAWEDYIDDQDS